MSWMIQAAMGVASGILGAMGLGGGGVLIIFLTIFCSVEQSAAQGINLIFFIPTAIVSCIMNIKRGLLNKKIFIAYSITGMMGALIGWWLSSFIDGMILKKLFGVFLLFVGLIQLFGSKKD